ncbi:MAG: TIGR04255 family protein [Planctomycetes bacterium]|nr:TIGR04255 family protein [Planctomycetota bacterium]
MLAHRHYQNAPITEAIIDLRVEPRRGITVRELQKAHAGQEAEYPYVEPLNVATGQMHVGPQVTTMASTKHIGFWFRSDDGKQIYQARLDGFTMSRLAPYECWESFRDEARRLWNVYRSTVNLTGMVRLAVRYINRIDIPLPLRDFKDYLRTVPEVSPDLPQGLTGYFMRLAIPQQDIMSVCLLSEAIIDPPSSDVVSVVLDIDVFRTEGLQADEEEIWAFIDKLRERKNQIFEACITDKTRELFE